LFLTPLMTKHEVISSLRRNTKCSWLNLAKFFKRNLNYIRLYLNRGRNRISMLITLEQGVLTSFLGSGSLELILGKFP
jgi:hypothetical protein